MKRQSWGKLLGLRDMTEGHRRRSSEAE